MSITTVSGRSCGCVHKIIFSSLAPIIPNTINYVCKQVYTALE